MEKLVKELRKKYDYVIFDSPPIALISDSFELLKLMDQCMIMVRMGVTTEECLPMIKELPRDYRNVQMNLIINGVKNPSISRKYYGSYCSQKEMRI
ncbi:hypothetical protein E1171_08865 [Cytophagales bacterium RKSG123]|nr:hypothetical protein [Xanthovirga aplysinae]